MAFKSFDFTFKLFGKTVSLSLDIYPAIKQDKWFEYGSTSNFGKWKVPPTSLINEYKPKRRRK